MTKCTRIFECGARKKGRLNIWKEGGKLTGLSKQVNKKEILQFSLVLQSSVLFAPHGRRASRHRRYLLNQPSSYLRW